ncbi:MAG: serine/threonine-protein kinase [Polyangiaceae bacterium]
MLRNVDGPPNAEAPPEGAGSLPQPGEIFDGKYRIERSIGRGNMAVVLEATHLQLQDRVAIKFLLPQWARSPESVERFMREGRAATRIRSEHVVRVFDVGVTGEHPYLVMEFLEGSDLDQVLAESGPLPIPLAVDYLLQACEAIAEAHTRGIVHRDLKPANLFLTRRADASACVKVLDFGISKAPESASADGGATAPTTVMGSPNYMSPEQMLSSTDVDARSDIWSLGAILHELLVKSPPFDGDTFAALSAAVLRDPAPRLESLRADVPPAIEAAVLRCLEKEPSRRFAHVAELAGALAPFGSGSARASAERIARVLDGGTGKISMPIARVTQPRSERAASLLAGTGLHAGAPRGGGRALGYVVAAVAFVGIGSGIAWMVVRNDRALRAAEQEHNAPAAAPQEPVATGAPTLTSASGSAPSPSAAPSPQTPPPDPVPRPAAAEDNRPKGAPGPTPASRGATQVRPGAHPRGQKHGSHAQPPGVPPLHDFPVPADPHGEPSSLPIARPPPAAVPAVSAAPVNPPLPAPTSASAPHP